MFDVYVTAQRGNPRRRLALQIAAIASGVTTASLIMFMWVADKLSISRVDPPTSSYINVSIALEEDPPPPPPPPPPPAGDTQEEEEEEEEEIPEEEVPMEEIVQPEKVQELKDPEKKPGTKGPKVPGGMPGGVRGGVPGGVVGGVVGGTLGGIPGGVATKRENTAAEDVAKKPIDAVRGQALYDPNPDGKKLAGTKAFTFDKRGGQSHVSFCVNTSGKTEEIRTVKKFPGDPKVDEICRDAVKTWRFKPFIVNGKPQKTCSVVKFDLKPE